MAAILQTKGGKALTTGILSLAAVGGGLALVAATATTAKVIGVAIAFYGANGLAAAHTTYADRRVTSQQFYSEWINETHGSAGAAISRAVRSVLSLTIISTFLRGFSRPRRRCHGHHLIRSVIGDLHTFHLVFYPAFVLGSGYNSNR